MKRLIMKYFLLAFFLFARDAHAFTVIVINDTTMSGTYDASGAVLKIQGKISGTVTIQNATIEANPFMQIFDTTVTIGNNVNIREFSGKWYGANSTRANNTRFLQKCIDQCVGRYSLYIPKGNYIDSGSLSISVYQGNGIFIQTSLKMYGEASFWDNGEGTQITYLGDSCAIGLQLNKGTEIHNLVISGKWVSPSGTDSAYFNTSYANYTNQSSSGGNGWGIWVDYYGNWSQRSGSTGCKFYDLKIEKFKTLIKISNSITQNGEIMRFDNIQLGEGKVGIEGSQPQEKMNVFDGIYSWSSLHTLFQFAGNAGNYYLTNINVAGRCIRLFNINSTGWFPTHISNVYAENFATIGTLSSYMPMDISNCLFDFIYPTNGVGYQTLVSTGTTKIKFDNCIFRYYGQGYNLNFSGEATYENCLFSGTVVGVPNAIFINYNSHSIDVGASSNTMTIKIDSALYTNPRLILRKSYKNP